VPLASFVLSLVLAAIFAAALPAIPQNLFPPGTIIPTRLNDAISSKRAKPGQTFTARVMQNVPLPDRRAIRAGARVLGHVVVVTAPSAKEGARISLKIDSLAVSGRTFPLHASLRAIASPLEVDDAQVPLEGPDRGTSPSAYTTIQVGGDVVYRGGGHVERDGQIVGEPAPNGVLVTVSGNDEGQCRGDAYGNNLPQALWVFSSDACGVYGYEGVRLVDAGKANPDGAIVIAAEHGELNIRGGGGLLLQVDAAAR
jgi:hypothetical protein